MSRHEERCIEYLKLIIEQNKNVCYKDLQCFSDGRKMFSWYRDEGYKLSKERKENIIPSKSRMEEIMMFAIIDDKLYEINKKNYERRCTEYLESITELNKNISDDNPVYFSDGVNAPKWYSNEGSKLSKEREEEIIPSKSRMEEIMMFAIIDDKLYEINKKNYERRCTEYLETIKKLNKNTSDDNPVYFSDGVNAPKWYSNENSKLSEERKENIIPSKSRMEEIMMFAIIDDKLYELKKNLYAKRCEEYLKLIIRTKKHASENNKSYFQDGADMYNWYHDESKKLSMERKNNIYPSKSRMEEIMMFAKISDEIYRKKLKLSA